MSNKEGWEDYLQRFSTKVLWHFTGYRWYVDGDGEKEKNAFDVLKAITREGQLNISEEAFTIIMPSGTEREGYRGSCLCDIPFKDLRIHTSRYGEFGIAFAKNEAIAQGCFNPVWYVHHKHPLFDMAESLLEIFDPTNDQESNPNKALDGYLRLIGTFAKRGNLTSNVKLGDKRLDDNQLNNFYYEREWRSTIPWNFKKGDVLAVMVSNESYAQLFKKHLEYIGADKKAIFENIPILLHDHINVL